MKIRHVEDLHTYDGQVRRGVYQLEKPLVTEDDCRDGFDHVLISAVRHEYAHETYIFPCDPDGDVISWSELDGSYTGGTDHQEAIDGAGWTLVEEF